MKIHVPSCLTAAGLALLCGVTSLRADYSSTVAGFSPLAYWRFSETATAPALNKVTNASPAGGVMDGIVVLDAVKGQAGIVGSSLRLKNPGAAAGYCGSKVDVPFNFALNKSGAFSVEVWVKPNDLGGDATGMAVFSSMMNDFSASSRVGYLMYVNNAGRFEFRLGNAGGYVGTVNNTANPAFNAAVGVWRHVVCIFNGTQTRIFVNGTNVANATLTSPQIAALLQNSQMPFRIGGTPFNGSLSDSPGVAAGGVSGNRGFDGWVDEVAYYPYALTTNQCAAHFAAATTNTAGYSAQILADGPAGYWPMNDPDYGTAPVGGVNVANSGSLGAAADGTVVWGGLTAQSGPSYAGFGGGNNAVLLDGANGFVKLGAPAGLDITGSITMMAWVKPGVKNFFRDIIARGWDANYAETFLRISRGTDFSGSGFGTTNHYEVGSTDGGVYDSVRVVMPEGDVGNWVFLAGTYDGGTWTLYRNGKPIGSIASGVGPQYLGTTNAWTIGAQSAADTGGTFEVPGGISTFFGGSIDEPAIFNTALSPTDILDIYNAAQVSPVITKSVTSPNGYLNGTWPTLFKGGSATMSVWAEGTPPLSYLWTSNGVSLGVTTTNLSLSNLPVGNPTYAVIVTNPYGSVTNSVTLTIIAAPPSFTQNPVSLARFSGLPFTFSVTTAGSTPQTYQWRTNGVDIPGATSASYGGIASAANAFAYTCVASNEAGVATSAPATLTVIPAAAGYSASVLGNSPISYWRLGEASGSTAYDYVGTNSGTYFNTTLNQPGYSVVDPDKAAAFSGDDSYAGLISGTAINFQGTNVSFTLECWANGAEGQPDESSLIAKGTGAEGTTANEQFALDVAFGHYRFMTRGSGGTIYSAEATIGPDGTWQHVVGVYDQSNPASPEMRIFVNGELSGSGPGRPPVNDGLRISSSPVSIGSKRLGNAIVYDGTFSGVIDEVAIYGSALSESAIQTQYGTAYGATTPPQISLQPKSVTNYAGLNASFSVGAFGTVPLSYQWKKDGVDVGGNSSILNLVGLAALDAGNYWCSINNSVGPVTNSAVAKLTVLAAPTSPPAMPGLVVHLPFNNNLTDITGRGNNGVGITRTGVASNTAAPTYVTDGQLGQGLHFASDFGAPTIVPDTYTTTNTSYVTLGVRPDLQFGTNVNFSVAFWIRIPLNFIGGDLPFFTTTSGSLGGQGFVFSPAYGYGNASGLNPDPAPLNYGGWGMSLYDSGSANGARVYGEIGSINDGLWHHLVFVFERNSQVVTYLDGKPAKSFKISGTTTAAAKTIDTGLPATIGQDPTGIYRETGSGDIDDLGVWKKALTPLEAASLYVAGINGLSFTNAPLGSIAIQSVGTNVVLTWGPLGALQSASTANGTYNDVPAATSPYTNAPTGTQKYYRLRP